MKDLDSIDVGILTALQADGRQTNVALAKSVGLSATPLSSANIHVADILPLSDCARRSDLA